MTEQQPERPVLTVVRGEPDAVELAALVAVVTAAASAGSSSHTPPARSAWADPSRSVRQPMVGGGWRTSFAPR
ncbi:MAG: acyl-CoA carboxylase epsilon subunit [Candidatus Nanopelagicales bacterium]